MLFAHGTNHSKGVLILFNENLQTDIKYVLATSNQGQCVFFDGVANTLENLVLDHNCQIIIGGDFNSHLDPNLGNLGGRIESKPSVEKINEIMTANDLIGIWRIRNPEKK